MKFTSLESLVPFAKLRANRGIYNGQVNDANMRLMALCRHQLILNPEVLVVLIFTRDSGYHSSGWWKNPDYERCLHLSFSFLEYKTGLPLPFDKKTAHKIADAFFGDHVRLSWVEPPYSDEGKMRDVWHYRVFCDPKWQPILPRGEVYDRKNTPPEWKSFSEIHGWQPAEKDAPMLMSAT